MLINPYFVINSVQYLSCDPSEEFCVLPTQYSSAFRISSFSSQEDSARTVLHDSEGKTEAETEDEQADVTPSDEQRNFNYLMGMPSWSSTVEEKNELLDQRDKKWVELAFLRKKSASELWMEDLNALLEKVRMTYQS